MSLKIGTGTAIFNHFPMINCQHTIKLPTYNNFYVTLMRKLIKPQIWI